MNARIAAVALSVCLPGAAVCAAAPAPSRIESVVLYRGQALVTRAVTLPEQAGELEVVVSDLPLQVVGASLHASATGTVKVRSVRYETRAAAEEPQKELAELDQQIKAVRRDLAAVQDHAALLAQKMGFLDKLEGFTAGMGKVEAPKGELNPKTMAEMTAQLFEQREALTKQRTALRIAEEDLNEKLQLLHRKRGELARGAEKTIRQGVLFLSKPDRGPGTVHLSYLVGSANWTPAYNVRWQEGGKALLLEYLAQVQQMSGEDWSGVKLTLSTATPAMNAQSPLLVPLWIGMAGVSPGGPLESAETYQRAQMDISSGQYGALSVWNVSGDRAALERANWEMNRLAAETQSLELNVREELVRTGVLAVRSVEEGLAVSYELDGAMSLASRSDQQLVQIARMELPAEAYHVAIPLLSTYVFRTARSENTSSVPLLAGPYSAYLDGEFVGRGELPLVARGQQFTIGLGVDTQLRCRRELLEKSDRISWGSRIQGFSYRLRVENYKDEPVAVRLLDRIPASKTPDIEVSLGKTSQKLSADPVYLRDFRDKGILRWDLEVPARAANDRSVDVSYGFEMKWAKDKHVGKVAASMVDDMQATFKEMLLKQ